MEIMKESLNISMVTIMIPKRLTKAAIPKMKISLSLLGLSRRVKTEKASLKRIRIISRTTST